MKKTNNNSPMKRIAASATMLAVSAAMLGTSTYAWFTMNKEVEVTGLTMKTKVSSNLLISSNNAEGTYKADQLVEGRKALLEPVSSITGKTGSFFYTLDAAENGSKAHAITGDDAITYIGYSEAKNVEDSVTNTNATAAAAGKYFYDKAFCEAYGIEPAGTEFGTAYGYVDYVFYLKATGNEANQELRMTACDLNYTYPDVNGTATDPGDSAWRIAVFASDITANGGKGNTGEAGSAGATVGALDPAGSNAKAILKTADSTGYFTADKAVATAGTLGYINATGAATDSAADYGAAVLDDDIDAGVTKYYKVLVRVWLEGEDKSCTTATYAKLENNWTLDLEFKLVSDGSTTAGETTVANITKNVFTPSIAATMDAVASPVDVNRAE